MFKTGPQVSAHNKEKQKQKKRLSFREPEVEVPKRTGNLFVESRRQNQVARTLSTGKELATQRSSSSVEDLSLEDQALQIAQSVGQAFSKPEVQLQNQQPGYLQKISHISRQTNDHKEQNEANKDCSAFDNASYQRSCQLRNFKITVEDQDFLEALSPPLYDTIMRCPTIEASGNVNSSKNSIPTSGLETEKFPSGAQHQIQMLKYQLEQQGQQTQTALHQVILLKDQLEAESTARYKAQTQNHQLMLQNKELLDHIERLFQQVEDLEKQVEALEQEKRPSKIPFLQEPQAQTKWSGPYGGRRLSSDQAMHEKTVTTSHSQIATSRRGSLTSTAKPNTPQTTSSQVQSTANKRGPMTASTSKPYSTTQNRPNDTVSKSSDIALRIGDISPPVQKAISSPFNTGWKSKIQEQSSQTITDKNATRARNNSFNSGVKLKQPDSKNSLLRSISSVNSSAGANKRYSGSASDLYNNGSGAFHASSKALMIEEPFMSNNQSAISNVSVNSSSKLPRFQPYSGLQRNNSLAKDCDQIGVIGKEAFQNAPETSLLFNR